MSFLVDGTMKTVHYKGVSVERGLTVSTNLQPYCLCHHLKTKQISLQLYMFILYIVEIATSYYKVLGFLVSSILLKVTFNSYYTIYFNYGTVSDKFT